ncbi:hypothetical protein GGP41_004874 [Bipolaris sorokiniana]|uniref:Ammonium transporter AmtB-like domain-containing protein n=1 Tax=Cochliobolus sativus TaxID=45130 RepID=A0A8H5ZEV2_COCSA|nr:hypothetical protein GGP41_004874 [Bipolaris sorokiniana]
MRFLFEILMLSVGSALAGPTPKLLLVVEGATTIAIQFTLVAINVMIVIKGAKLYSGIVSEIGNS